MRKQLRVQVSPFLLTAPWQAACAPMHWRVGRRPWFPLYISGTEPVLSCGTAISPARHPAHTPAPKPPRALTAGPAQPRRARADRQQAAASTPSGCRDAAWGAGEGRAGPGRGGGLPV